MSRRRHSEEEHENHERWLVSYADFITLLFAFFVVMYAISSVNEGKYRVLSNSLVAAFRNIRTNTNGPKLASGTVLPMHASTPSLPEPVVMLRRVVRRKEVTAAELKREQLKRDMHERMRNMAEQIVKALGPLVKQGRVRIVDGARGVTVEINASVLFAPGEAQLEAPAVDALQLVGNILAKTDFPITVEGYTDTTPIDTPQFPSNWELSVVRASTVVRLFIAAGVSPKQLTATGYGEERPIASNDTAEGRQRNRRVSILIEAPLPDTSAPDTASPETPSPETASPGTAASGTVSLGSAPSQTPVKSAASVS